MEFFKKSKKSSCNFPKNKSGITLIALTITMILMVILVSVSLNLISGDGGIISKTIRAEMLTRRAKVKEEARNGII